MTIDEDKLEYDLSDHCLINADFEIENNPKEHKMKTKEIEIYSSNKKYKNRYVMEMETLLETVDEHITLDVFERMVQFNA